MAKRTREELMQSVREIFKDDTSDEVLTLIEDLSDTLDGIDGSGDGTDWRTRYEENDAQWRQKYKDRFFSKPAQEDPDDLVPDETNEPKTFSDLFKGE